MTTQTGPGKSYRKGISLIEAVKAFDTEEKAEAWFIEHRWPNGVACPHCGGMNIAMIANRKPQPLPVSWMPQALLSQDGYALA